jgi:hypothetical protein
MKRLLILLAIIGGISILGTAALVGLVVLGIHGVSSRQPTEAEKELLISVACLKDFEIDGLAPELCESYVAKRNLDGSLGLEYEYDSDKSPDRSQALYFSSEVEINRSVKDARESFFMSIQAFKLGMKFGKDIRLEESQKNMGLAEQEYWAVIKNGASPVGNLVVLRQGTAVHSLMVTGVHFADWEDLKCLLQTTLEKEKNFTKNEKDRS